MEPVCISEYSSICNSNMHHIIASVKLSVHTARALEILTCHLCSGAVLYGRDYNVQTIHEVSLPSVFRLAT